MMKFRRHARGLTAGSELADTLPSSPRTRVSSRLNPYLAAAAQEVLATGPDWAEYSWSIDKLRLNDDLDLVARFPGRLLEVGSSPYFTTLALTMSGRDVTGVDIDPSQAPARVEVLRCDIERDALPFGECSFDVILFSEVFEHLRLDPLFTLSELRRVLRPDGVLLLTTPNLRSLRGILRLTLRGKAWAVGADPYEAYMRLKTHGFMGHVREYTAWEMRAMLEPCGFTIDGVVWRRKPGNWLLRGFELLVPPSRPYMTLIARRTERSAV